MELIVRFVYVPCALSGVGRLRDGKPSGVEGSFSRVYSVNLRGSTQESLEKLEKQSDKSFVCLYIGKMLKLLSLRFLCNNDVIGR